MNRKINESMHQQFGRFIRDEMSDNEKEIYIKSDRYKRSILLLSEIFKKNSIN